MFFWQNLWGGLFILVCIYYYICLCVCVASDISKSCGPIFPILGTQVWCVQGHCQIQYIRLWVDLTLYRCTPQIWVLRAQTYNLCKCGHFWYCSILFSYALESCFDIRRDSPAVSLSSQSNNYHLLSEHTWGQRQQRVNVLLKNSWFQIWYWSPSKPVDSEFPMWVYSGVLLKILRLTTNSSVA